MVKKLSSCVLLAVAASVGSVDPAYAQRTAPAFRVSEESAKQTLNFTFGLFTPRAEDRRVAGDVLAINRTFLVFEIDEFRSGTFGAEWLLPIGNFVEAGAGVSIARKTVPTVYADFIDGDGTEIDSDLSLRQMPVALTVRVLPFGQDSPVQPYIGGGLNIIKWRYSEVGEFIDANDLVFEGEYVAEGWKTGPVILGGVRFASSSAVIGGEFRYQKAHADLPSTFFGTAIDLGGWTVQGTLGVRF